MIDFKAEAQAMYEELVACRRDLHRHPELAFEEVRTAGIIADELRRLGLEVQTGVGKTGVVGILEGAADGPTVLYRADMDALPIEEENDVEYVSTVPGKMHACGHDGHVAIGLGIARLLSRHREQMHGRVKFAFQPAEEGGAGGARAMIKAGLLDDPEPVVVLGIHLWNTLPLGTVGVAEGAIMSGSSFFTLMINGLGGHAAMPHTTIDPVACAGQLVTALHNIVGRKMDSMAGAVILSVTSVRSSSEAYNVIPAHVEVRGTFRTFNAYTSELLEQHIRSVSQSMCEAMGCSVDISIRHSTIPTMNDPTVVARARRAFTQVCEDSCLDPTVRTMASEDVSYLLDDVPGMYVLLGSANAELGLDYGHHHPRFDFDENALPLGVALMSAALADYILPGEDHD